MSPVVNTSVSTGVLISEILGDIDGPHKPLPSEPRATQILKAIPSTHRLMEAASQQDVYTEITKGAVN